MLVYFFIIGLVVAKLDILGNKAFKTDMLRREVLAIKEGDDVDEVDIRRAKNMLENFYHNKGFWGSEVDMMVVRKDSLVYIYFYIKEGFPMSVREIELKGTEGDAFCSKDMLAIREGEIYDYRKILVSMLRLRQLYELHGYPEAEVDYECERIGAYEVRLVFKVKKGPQVRIGEIEVRGNSKARKDMILREAGIKKGELYSTKRVDYAQSRLYMTGLFDKVEVVTERMDSTTVKLIFKVKERKPRWVKGEFGIGGFIETYASIGWGYDNLFGWGEKLQLEVRYFTNFKGGYDWRLYSRYTTPYFLKFRWNVSVTPFYELKHRVAPDYEIRTWGVRGETKRGITRHVMLYLAYDQKWRRLSIGEAYQMMATRLPIDTSEITNVVSADILIDTRDNPFRPERGVLGRLGLRYAGYRLGGDNDFEEMGVDFTWYYKYDFMLVATRVKLAGKLSGRLPQLDRYFLGGPYSLRGYETDGLGRPYGKENMVVSNVEVRVRLPGDFMMVYFVDVGEVGDGVLWEWLRTIKRPYVDVGFGLWKYLFVGVVRLDIAMPVVPQTGSMKWWLVFGEPF